MAEAIATEEAEIKLTEWRPSLIAVGASDLIEQRPRIALIFGDKQILLVPTAARLLARQIVGLADLIQGRDS